MADTIELTPRVRDALYASDSGRRILAELGERTEGLLEYPKKILSALWRHKGKLLSVAALLSLGNSAGVFARLAPLMGRAGFIADGLNTAGGWVSRGGGFLWGHLRNLATTLGVPNIVPDSVETGHKLAVDATRFASDRVIPAPPAPPAP